MLEWYEFFNKSEEKHMEMIVCRRNIKLGLLPTKIFQSKENLSPFVATQEYKDKSINLKKQLTKYDNDIKKKKVKKHQRDIKDYKEGKVYRWQEDMVKTISRNSSMEQEVVQNSGQDRTYNQPPRTGNNVIQESGKNPGVIQQGRGPTPLGRELGRPGGKGSPQYNVHTEDRFLPLRGQTPQKTGTTWILSLPDLW